MRYTFRPLGQWPGQSTTNRRGRHTFKASWQDTLWLLEKELDNLEAELLETEQGERDALVEALRGLEL